MKLKLSSIPTKVQEKLDKEHTKKKTEKLLEELLQMQKILYAQEKYSVLIILQGLDASGKDGVVNKVFSGLNPLGIDVRSFKAPTEEERKHDFLWRIHEKVPMKGQIMIFNRSQYEDVLVPVVEKYIDRKTKEARYKHINNFESLLVDNNTILLKFYLHISQEEQLERLTERKTNPEKFWKHNDGDWETTKKWDQYITAYEQVFENCNDIPWTIVPADQNWYKEFIIADKLVSALKQLDLEYPKHLIHQEAK